MQFNISIVFLLILMIIFHLPKTIESRSRNRYPDPKLKSKPKPKPPKLNTDILPPLQEILEKLNLMKNVKDFIKMGVTETRLLIRLTEMDFRMMSIEWENITEDEIKKLKNEILLLYNQALVIEDDVINPEINERNKLSYGRVYITNAVQSFEYLSASFGGIPPIGKLQIVIAPDTYACNMTSSNTSEAVVATSEEKREDKEVSMDLSGKLLIALRGNCTFLTKAKNAFYNNASALVIVNTEDKLERPSSGYGVDKNITDAMVQEVNQLPILTFSNTSWIKLITAMKFHPMEPLYANIVPLLCRSGGTCQPVLAEERELLPEVSWGTLRLRGKNTNEVRSYEFLSSNFGGILPVDTTVPIVLADTLDGCNDDIDVNNDTSIDIYSGAAVVVNRGSCRFDTKAIIAQKKGARILIIVDVEDNALQRVGGMAPESGYVGIPSIIVTAVTGEYIRNNIHNNLYAEFIPALDSSGADSWIELAFTTWSEGKEEKLIQLEGLIQKYGQIQSKEILAWLYRRRDELTAPLKTNIDTDEL